MYIITAALERDYFTTENTYPRCINGMDGLLMRKPITSGRNSIDVYFLSQSNGLFVMTFESGEKEPEIDILEALKDPNYEFPKSKYEDSSEWFSYEESNPCSMRGMSLADISSKFGYKYCGTYWDLREEYGVPFPPKPQEN